MRRTDRIRSLIAGVIASSLVSIACGMQSNTESTAQALGEAFNLTATAQAGTAPDTGGSDGGVSVEAIQANATGTAQSRAATRAVEDAQEAATLGANATAVAPIIAELPTYGVDPSEGHLGWIHDPAVLVAEEHMDYAYINDHIGTIAVDFVISGDITWNTSTGIAGCGFVLRSNGNTDALAEYLVLISRGSNGALAFIKQSPGNELQETPFDNVENIDQNFQWQNDTTNRLTVVGRGDTFSIYTNGVYIGQVSDSAYTRGFVAMVALSESGQTRCQFDNTWLWLLD
jgi:hypothetical protein